MAHREMPGKNYSENGNNEIKKAPTEKIVPVAHGRARKRSAVENLMHYIFEDTLQTAKEVTIKEVLLPGIRDLLFDTINGIIGRALYGNDIPKGGFRSNKTATKPKVSYGGFYSLSQHAKNTHTYNDVSYSTDDIITDTRQEANDVLRKLDEIIRTYGQASVATFYDIVGISGNWTDNKFGWTSIRGAGVRPVRDGYLIELPPAVELDD